MHKIITGFFLMLAFLIFSCDDSEVPLGDPTVNNNPTGYKTIEDLPECTDDTEGDLYYISGTDEFRYCTYGKYVLIDINPVDYVLKVVFQGLIPQGTVFTITITPGDWTSNTITQTITVPADYSVSISEEFKLLKNKYYFLSIDTAVAAGDKDYNIYTYINDTEYRQVASVGDDNWSQDIEITVTQ